MSLHKFKYSSEMLKGAYDDVTKNGIPVRKAARNHGVPESTLRLRLSCAQPVAKIGAPTIFTSMQEEQLAQHCVKMAHIGYGYTRWQIMDIAKNMCSVIGKDGVEPTKHWFYGFMNRFRDLKMVHPKKREKARDDAVNKDVLDNYFKELTQIMEKLHIKDVPANIWNVDETAINLDHTPPKILAKSGTNPHIITAGRSSNTTLIAAGSALGQTIPPYIIFKGDRLSKENCSKGLKGTQYRATLSGWSNSATFLDFFSNHFLQHVKTRPCLLLYDGHSTHINAEVIEIARQEDVHLFVLPPHSSHILQPLDVSVFSPFKKSLNSEFHKYLHAHPYSIITVDVLPQLIANSYSSAMIVSAIMAGFRKSGIFPLDPTAPTVKNPVVKKNDHNPTPTRKERKDNRNVKILFEESDNTFMKTKENAAVKVKRKTFIPPYGATITEDAFYVEAKRKQDEKKRKEKMEKKTPSDDKKQNTSGDDKEANKPGRKRKSTFSTPFIVLNEEKENQEPTKKAKIISRKGKGPHPNSKSGKAIMKKQPKNLPSHLENDSVGDEEKCFVCKKWQPDGLRLDKSLKFVSWGQCSKCDKWIHLKFCTPVEHLGEDEDFLCPVCSNEQ